MAPKDKKSLTPDEVQKIKDAAAAAKEEILSKAVLDAVLNADPANMIVGERDPERKKGNLKGPQGWVHGPGHVELLAMAGRRFIKVANDQGLPGRHVERAQASVIPGTEILVLKAAPANDLTAIEISRYKGSSSLWINCYDVLVQVGLTVDTGWKELYDVAYIPKASPLWPGLLINFGDRKDRQAEPVPKRKKKTTQPDAQKDKPDPQNSTNQQPATPAPDTNPSATDPAPDQSPETSQQPAE
jgi:hypothetical protein